MHDLAVNYFAVLGIVFLMKQDTISYIVDEMIFVVGRQIVV